MPDDLFDNNEPDPSAPDADPNQLTPTQLAMQAGGVSPLDSAFEDYFGFGDRKQFVLPDGNSYIEYKVMNEGDRQQFQNQTSRNVRLFKDTGDASIRMNPAVDRMALLIAGVTDWNLRTFNPRSSQMQAVKFDSGRFRQWVMGADPKIIDGLEKAIRKANPWVGTADVTVEALNEEIENLTEQRDALIAEEEGKLALN